MLTHRVEAQGSVLPRALFRRPAISIASLILSLGIYGSAGAQLQSQQPVPTVPSSPSQPPQTQPQKKSKPPKKQKETPLEEYLAKARGWQGASALTTGSLWNPQGMLSDMAADAKARHRGDLITIQLAESTTSALQGSVQTSRTYAASSGISAFFGLPVANSPVANMFSPSSSQALNGKGQTALSTNLNTTLAANVVEVLPDGLLVIEASRDVTVSDQWQTMVLRGIIRHEDISPSDVVASTAISHMEVDVEGHGVITEGTHQPPALIRFFMRMVGF
jgi:flagellar L-ring protein FlgH